MGFQVCLVLIAILPVIDANNNVSCRLVRPSYLPPELWGEPNPNRLPPCVNYDILLPEVRNLTNRLPQTLAEFGLTNIESDLEELQHGNCTVLLKGEVGPVHCGDETAQHFTRVGLVIHLIYNVTVGGDEQLFAFASERFENLTANDTLEGPVQSLQDSVEGFNGSYPAASAEAMPSLVQDYYDLLDSFNCSTSGHNCNLTRGEEAVVPLDERWSIVARQGFEYEPSDSRRAIRLRCLFLSFRALRLIPRIFALWVRVN
ncbi:uncharacterized protein LOC118404240 [Branchiostoma floridae]|uniref:Uncharacterized protein LOC118404240 n=1 Tax=Branchiostoma floridae TaxID=7739 RepID=A0A9J7HL07_BRAFL|nr:uncharacterized protein LOC118404240 [Branchiostoma floridae]